MSVEQLHDVRRVREVPLAVRPREHPCGGAERVEEPPHRGVDAAALEALRRPGRASRRRRRRRIGLEGGEGARVEPGEHRRERAPQGAAVTGRGEGLEHAKDFFRGRALEHARVAVQHARDRQGPELGLDLPGLGVRPGEHGEVPWDERPTFEPERRPRRARPRHHGGGVGRVPARSRLHEPQPGRFGVPVHEAHGAGRVDLRVPNAGHAEGAGRSGDVEERVHRPHGRRVAAVARRQE